MILFIIFSFLFGTIIGSFLNVVAYRYNTGRPIVFARSQCFSCGRTLRWFELLPLASFLAQRGRCRQCGSRISWQYFSVELLTGLLFAAIVAAFPPLTAATLGLDILRGTMWSILVVIVVYDIRHKIIPDGLVFLFAVLALIHMFMTIPSLANTLAGPILFLPFFLLWFVSRGKWMGLGDAKLAVGIGWLLGLGYGISAIILAFWLGAAVGIVLLVLQKFLKHGAFIKLATMLGLHEKIMKSELPFAPFLVLAMALTFFLHLDVTGMSLLF
jgi:leader peptidase (prepilin peptidase)/N-methyltransferase